MLLGVALHAAMSFVTFPWPVRDSERSDVLLLLIGAVHGFRMPLFFLLSGYFTMLVFSRRGLVSLLEQRFTRIFLPLVIAFAAIAWTGFLPTGRGRWWLVAASCLPQLVMGASHSQRERATYSITGCSLSPNRRWKENASHDTVGGVLGTILQSIRGTMPVVLRAALAHHTSPQDPHSPVASPAAVRLGEHAMQT